jgi:ElaB/YqjD/DUF883 family membrane-anchored ribosome-binding protein
MHHQDKEVSLKDKLKNLVHQAEEIFDRFEDKAEATLDKAEGKAKEIWQQAKKSEVTKQAQETIGNLLDDAASLLEKIKNQIDGNSKPTNDSSSK